MNGYDDSEFFVSFFSFLKNSTHIFTPTHQLLHLHALKNLNKNYNKKVKKEKMIKIDKHQNIRTKNKIPSIQLGELPRGETVTYPTYYFNH